MGLINRVDLNGVNTTIDKITYIKERYRLIQEIIRYYINAYEDGNVPGTGTC